MVYYLNRGFIVEQALADIIQRYFQRLRFNKLYNNFCLTVTNDHPFANLILRDEAANTADTFPCVVVTTQSESIPSDFHQLSEQMARVELTATDIDTICNKKRVRTYINDEGKEIQYKNRAGETQMEQIPGFCVVTEDGIVEELKQKAGTGSVSGVAYTSRKKDRVSIEIWAENNQLKNEIYEHLRILISTTLSDLLRSEYKDFAPDLFINSMSGERSNNFNFDFDCILYGGHITFEVDYFIQQILIDTDADNIKNIEWEVINHVKEN